MRPLFRRVGPLLIALAVSGVATLSAQALAPAAPTTPGSLALLGNSLDGYNVTVVAAALSASDPAVRTVAARIAAVTSHPPFAAALSQALPREEHADAAAEQVRALLNIRGDTAVAEIDAVRDRLPAAAALVYANWLVRNRPELLVDRAAALGSRMPGEVSGFSGVIRAVLESKPELGPPLLAAWRQVAEPVAWQAAIGYVDFDKAQPELIGVVKDALVGPLEFRTATMSVLIRRAGDGKAVPPALLEAATAAADNLPSTDDDWIRIAQEILARQLRRKAGADLSARFARHEKTRWSDLIAVARTSYLTDAERTSLRRLLGDEFPRAPQGSPPAEPGRTGVAIRTMPTLWPDFFTSLMSAAGCAPRGNQAAVGIMDITYGPKLTPVKVSVTPTKLSPECDRVLGAMARLTLADPDYLPPPGSADVVLLFLDAESVGCSGTTAADASGVPRLTGRITPPRKTRDVKPIYPLRAQQLRVQGTVVLEGIIGVTGCVAYAKVLRSAAGLELAALQAVWRWRFKPAEVGGQVIPVMMTVTVSFTLQ